MITAFLILGALTSLVFFWCCLVVASRADDQARQYWRERDEQLP